FALSRPRPAPHLHSFPTRRSSDLLSELREWLSAFSKLLTAEFQVVGIQTKSEPPRTSANSIRLQTMVRFELLGTGAGFHREQRVDRKSTRLNSSHDQTSYAVFCLK